MHNVVYDCYGKVNATDANKRHWWMHAWYKISTWIVIDSEMFVNWLKTGLMYCSLFLDLRLLNRWQNLTPPLMQPPLMATITAGAYVLPGNIFVLLERNNKRNYSYIFLRRHFESTLHASHGQIRCRLLFASKNDTA